jgi:Protein of unknown function (DUF3142)
VALTRVLALVMLVSLVGVPAPTPPDRMAGLPSVLLWAWERPEDLRFAPRLGVGVAALDRTITVRGSRIETALRRQRLLLDPATPVVAVVRVEADRGAAQAADSARVAEAVVAAAQRPGIRALQIDFDATASQRAFYAALLSDVRRRLPRDLPLSMTALASWCAGDTWIEALPVDEAVPMLFEMGPDRVAIAGRVRQDAPFGEGRCAQAFGVSTREPLGRVPLAARAYVFTYQPWTFETAAAAVRGVQR